jgi:ABC-2 type transport system permease protein
MRKTLIIAQREFRMGIQRKAFALSAVIFPLAILGIGAANSFNSATVSSRSSHTIGVIDRAGAIDFSLAQKVLALEAPPESDDLTQAPDFRVTRFEEMQAALQDLASRKLDALFVLPSDFPATSTVEIYTRDGASPKEMHGPELAVFHSLLRASVLASVSRPETVDRVLSPVDLSEYAVADDGTVTAARRQSEKLVVLMAPVGLIMLLGFWIMMSSRLMFAAATEESTNRAMEVMLSSVKPDQLLGGKLIGLSALSLLQLAVFFAIVGTVRSTFWTFLNLPAGTLALCLIFCIAGYLFYSGLMITIGMTGWARSAGIMQLSVWVPVIFLDSISGDPNGDLARILSLIPWTSPLTMVVRLGVGAVPVPEVLGSLAVLAAGSYLILRGGTRLFRANTLMLGKRVSVSEIGRALRAS